MNGKSPIIYLLFSDQRVEPLPQIESEMIAVQNDILDLSILESFNDTLELLKHFSGNSVTQQFSVFRMNSPFRHLNFIGAEDTASSHWGLFFLEERCVDFRLIDVWLPMKNAINTLMVWILLITIMAVIPKERITYEPYPNYEYPSTIVLIDSAGYSRSYLYFALVESSEYEKPFNNDVYVWAGSNWTIGEIY